MQWRSRRRGQNPVWRFRGAGDDEQIRATLATRMNVREHERTNRRGETKHRGVDWSTNLARNRAGLRCRDDRSSLDLRQRR
jgi:hypothetical protein